MYFRGSTYNIPITIWILDTHPHKAPLVNVCPTDDMQIWVGCRHVDRTGKVNLPYLSDWSSADSDLQVKINMNIIENMLEWFANVSFAKKYF